MSKYSEIKLYEDHDESIIIELEEIKLVSKLKGCSTTIAFYSQQDLILNQTSILFV